MLTVGKGIPKTIPLREQFLVILSKLSMAEKHLIINVVEPINSKWKVHIHLSENKWG